MLYTPDSREGTPYPRLGRVLERFADLLRLKSVLREDQPPGFASWKTCQRLFAGEPVSDEVLGSVVRALLDGLVPAAGLSAELASPGVTAADRVRALIVGQLAAYERYATEVAMGQFPLMRPELAVYPYLRLLAFDMGLRYGAWMGLSARRGRELPDRPPWLACRAFAKTLEVAREATSLSLEQLATRCEVSVTTVKKWRSGTLPENRHIEALAKVLHGDVPLPLYELHLRLSALAQGLLREFAPDEESAWWVDDLLRAFETTARLVREALAAVVVADVQRLEVDVLRVIDDGASTQLGRDLCDFLAGRALVGMRQEVQLDFRLMFPPR